MEDIITVEDTWPLQAKHRGSIDYWTVVGVTTVSTLAFYTLSVITSKWLTPACISPEKIFTWKTTFVSFVHSTLIGTSSVVVFRLVEPETWDDFLYISTPMCHWVMATTLGYFIHDAIDIAINTPKSTVTLMVHHAVPILNISTVFYYNVGFAYSILLLFMELSSSTLHLRLLLKLVGANKPPDLQIEEQALPLNGINKSECKIENAVKFTDENANTIFPWYLAYWCAVVLNLVTFTTLRFGILFYTFWFISQVHTQLNMVLFLEWSIGSVVLGLIFVGLFVQLVKSDFFDVNKKHR